MKISIPSRFHVLSVLGRDAGTPVALLAPDASPAHRYGSLCVRHTYATAWDSAYAALVAALSPTAEWCPFCEREAEPICSLCDAPGRVSQESRWRDVSEDRWRLVAALPCARRRLGYAAERRLRREKRPEVSA